MHGRLNPDGSLTDIGVAAGVDGRNVEVEGPIPAIAPGESYGYDAASRRAIVREAPVTERAASSLEDRLTGQGIRIATIEDRLAALEARTPKL